MKETRFKETEIGRIPEDWSISFIGDECSVNTGSKNTQDKIDNGKYPFYVRSQEIERINSYSYDCEAVLTAGDGGTGKVFHYINGKFEVHQRVYIMNNFSDRLDGQFFYRYFAQNFYNRINQMTAKSTVDSVRKEMITKMYISFPSKEEQTRIASALTSIDNLISSLDKLIEKKKNIKQGTMQQLLTGKKRLNGFNGPWVEIELDTIFDLKKGNGLSKEKISIDGIYKCMLYGEIFTRFNYITNRHFHKTNYPEGILSKIGDVLMPASTTTKGIDLVKAVAINEDSVLLGGDIIILRKKKNNQDSYFWATLISEVDKSKVADKTQGITIIHLHTNSLKNIRYTVPSSYKEQSAIASVLTSMDNAIAALEAKKAKYEQIKQGMMQQLLTGKIRLVESASESKARKANIHFKRSVVAAEIADRLCEEPTFGHVKMMKMLFLAERLCHIELDSHYHRDAAGPYDNRALRSIDGQLKRQGWFEAKNVGGRIVYIPLQRRGNHKKYFNKYYAGCASVLDKITETFRTMTTEQCEIVATLFSAWEDLLHAGKSCTENDIVNEVLNNWHESKQRISREHWLNAIVWMRREGFVPQRESL